MNRLNIAKLRKHLKMTQEEFSNRIGFRQSYLSEIENNKKPLTEEIYDAIVEYFGIDTISPFIENCDNIAKDDSILNIPLLEEISKQAIPHIADTIAVCGMPSGFEIAIKKSQCNLYLIPDLKGCDFTVRAGGDSMINRKNPKRSIRDKDIVGCRLWKSRTHLRWGEVYALATVDGVVIKKIMPSETDGFIKCVSFNEEDGFLPYELKAEEIQDWAIVVGVVSVTNWI